ncbi:PLP-dependent cysteine synthase family protein [Pectobacterium versatile]|uniref:PLP-dependent cysteine synthase family protein n=1 Tax=Pectobacterium versatile TaxID=2488639 RepID=UPI00381B8FE4
MLSVMYSFFKRNLFHYFDFFKFENNGLFAYQANHGIPVLITRIDSSANSEKMKMKYNSILNTVGNTPCVRINTFDTQGVNVHLKMETTNPGGSIKDRIAISMLEKAESKGVLRKGMIVIEPSSGNTAIGLAMACAAKGYKFIAILDRMVPSAKRDKIKAYGADIIFLPEFEDGIDTVLYRIELTKKIISLYPNAFSPMQFENEDNPQEHYDSTAREIYSQFSGDISGVFITAGSCGTITGVSRYLKEMNPAIKVFAVEPMGSIIFGGEAGKYFVQGAGLAFRPKILDDRYIDDSIKISDFTAFKIARELARKEGILIGGTGACALSAGLERLNKFNQGDNVVIIIPDSGERYVDTIYSDIWLAKHGFSELIEKSDCDNELTSLVYELGCTLNDF